MKEVNLRHSICRARIYRLHLDYILKELTIVHVAYGHNNYVNKQNRFRYILFDFRITNLYPKKKRNALLNRIGF